MFPHMCPYQVEIVREKSQVHAKAKNKENYFLVLFFLTKHQKLGLPIITAVRSST